MHKLDWFSQRSIVDQHLQTKNGWFLSPQITVDLKKAMVDSNQVFAKSLLLPAGRVFNLARFLRVLDT